MFKYNPYFFSIVILCFVLFQLIVPSLSYGLDNEFLIFQEGYSEWPSVAFDGTNYLVVWQQNAYDIYGTRVAQDGEILDPEGIQISTALNNQTYPAVAFGGTNYLVVWMKLRNSGEKWDIYGAQVNTDGIVIQSNILISEETRVSDPIDYPGYRVSVAFDGINYFVIWVDKRDGYPAIYGTRVSTDGEVLDLHGIPISAIGYDEYCPNLVFGITHYLVCWVCSLNPNESQIQGALMQRNGTVTQQIGPISTQELLNYAPCVAFDGINYLVIWNWVTDFSIWGRTVSLNGNCIDNPFLIHPIDGNRLANFVPDVEFDGMTYLTVWENNVYPPPDADIYGRRISPERVLIEPEIVICGTQNFQWLPSIAFGGKNYLIAWQDDRNGNFDIYGTLIDATLISKDATGPNQGRHLARAPNTTDLDWAYHTNIGSFWKWKGDLITNRPTYIERGKYPTIAKKELDAPWVVYTTVDSLIGLLKVQGTPNSWIKRPIKFSGGNILSPSLVLSATEAPPQAGDMGYVVYTTLNPTADNCIRFSAFDGDGVYYERVLDQGSDISSPSIAVTPGDYLHVAWRKDNKIYYITTRQPVYPDAIRQGAQPDWSTIDRVSTDDPLTEPASNPFVEAQGEFIYVVWRGPNQEGNPDYGEIWQRRGRIRPPQTPLWDVPENKSQTLNEESNFPTMSTGSAVVWQESIPENPPNNPANYEIYGDIIGVGNNINLTQTGKNSCFPHTNLLPAPPYSLEDWQLSTIWTEESVPDTFYQVRY